ncbi:hypothetical protein [Ekhidna sp.]|uniref:hypothetical protein n=1 Tax=Ekhidna sp. TaxID=2608089 RepID=UPI0032996B02
MTFRDQSYQKQDLKLYAQGMFEQAATVQGTLRATVKAENKRKPLKKSSRGPCELAI